MSFTYTHRLPVALGTISLVVLLSLSSLVQAETKTIVSEATYMMGDGETPSFAESMVLQKAKQRALEEAGTYVESYTKVRNLDLTEEEIQTIAGGVLQVEVLEKKRSTVGEGFQFFIKIKATVTTDRVQDLAQRIKGRNVAGEYEKLQEDYAKLNKELNMLKQRVATSLTGPDRQESIEQIRDRERAFASVQKRESAFFQRLVSGEELSSKATSQLADKQARKQKEDAVIAALFEQILDSGHVIAIGEPEVETKLESPEDLSIRVLVTIKAGQEMKSHIKRAQQELGDEIAYSTLQGIEKRLNGLTFVLEAVVGSGQSYKCHASYAHSAKLRKIDTDADFLMIDKGVTQFNASLRIPTKRVKEVTAVRGKFVFDTPGGECGIKLASPSMR